MNNINFNTNQLTYWIPLTISIGMALVYKLYKFATDCFADKAAKEKLLNEFTETNSKLQEENKALKQRIDTITIHYQTIETKKKIFEQTNELLYKKRRELLLADISKAKYVYDRALLCKNYTANNKGNTYRTKPLKIMKMETTDPNFRACMKKWFFSN